VAAPLPDDPQGIDDGAKSSPVYDVELRVIDDEGPVAVVGGTALAGRSTPYPGNQEFRAVHCGRMNKIRRSDARAMLALATIT